MIFLIQIKPVKPRTSAAPHREQDKRERDSCREKEAGWGGDSVVSLSSDQIADERGGVRDAERRGEQRLNRIPMFGFFFFKAVRKSSVRRNLGGHLEYLHLFSEKKKSLVVVVLQRVKCSDSTALHCVFGKNETPTQGGGQHGSVAHQQGVILPRRWSR